MSTTTHTGPRTAARLRVRTRWNVQRRHVDLCRVGSALCRSRPA